MGKIIIHATMSMDGFIAGPDDEIDWIFKYKDDEMVDKVMKDIGADILGKRTFEISLKNNSLPYGGMIEVPQFVITNKAQQAKP